MYIKINIDIRLTLV